MGSGGVFKVLLSQKTQILALKQGVFRRGGDVWYEGHGTEIITQSRNVKKNRVEVYVFSTISLIRGWGGV